jgi:uncharacterized protein
MTTNADKRGFATPALRPLSEIECWSLLRSHDLGRIAIMIDGWPEVFPVNYVAEDGAVVFRSAVGAKLEHGPNSRACFEVDGWDDATGTGWGVMVQGILRDITDAKEEDASRLRQLPLHPAAPGVRNHVLALFARKVTGRHFSGGRMVRPVSFDLLP